MTHAYPTRRGLLLGAGAVVGLSALPRMARAQQAVGFQLSWLHSVQFAGSYIAQQRGWWRDAGLQVALMQGGPNAPVEPPVVAGSALVGISAADYTAAAVAQGAPFKIIGVAMQKTPSSSPRCPEIRSARPRIWRASASAWRLPIPLCCRRWRP